MVGFSFSCCVVLADVFVVNVDVANVVNVPLTATVVGAGISALVRAFSPLLFYLTQN